MAEPLEIEDFSGGVTDYYLNAPLNKSKQLDNLLLLQYPEAGKPFTRPGSAVFDIDNAQIPAGAQRISTCFYYKDTLFLQSSKKLYWYTGSAISEIEGPVDDNDAFNGADANSVFTYAHWNFHTLFAHSGQWYPQKMYIDNTDTPQIIEAGLPQFDASGVVVTPTGGGNTWLYRYVYKYTYVTKDNITFIDYGTPSSIKSVTSAATTVAHTNIPVLSNGATGNFDTVNIKIEIYRTINNGNVFYLVGEITNGTTTYDDNTSDSTLTAGGGTRLYTEGGLVARDRPPKSRLVHIFGDIAYFADIIDSTGARLRYRCLQSIPGAISAAPATFNVDIDDEIAGLSSTKSNLILLGKGNVYRVDGFYDETGRGGMTAERISDTASCISAQSAVQALDGLFWAGLDGIYYTDGFRVIKLNADYDKSYRAFVSSGLDYSTTKQNRIQGKYDKKKNRIWWTVQRESATDVDACYVLDLNWGVRENATFTTVSGLSSFSPTAIEFYNNRMIRCDRRGYILYHSDNLFSDIKIDTSVAAADWVKQTIFYDYTSIAYNFGTAFTRKYVTGITVACESTTNLSLQIISNNDDQKSIADLSPIRYRGNVTWGDPDVYWGDPNLEWNRAGLINEKRRMPAKNLRCNYKQIQMTNAFVAIFSSDILGVCDVDADTSTATLTGTFEWPDNSVDWYISFAMDGFEREYLVTDVGNDTLIFDDPNSLATTQVGSEWVLRGYPKDEVLNLLNYALAFDYLGQTQKPYQNSSSGEVGSGET